MDKDWYAEWVRLHCQVTGADAAAARALLTDIVRGVLLAGGTTAEELGEVTARLVARHETPKFANEHSDSVGLELVRLREERARDRRPAAAEEEPDCPLCGRSGFVTVPVPGSWWRGRLVCQAGGYKTPLPGGVLCDRPGCPAGERQRRAEAARAERRPTFLAYCRRLGADAHAAWREYEAGLAAAARAGGPPGGGVYQMFEAIIERAKHGREAA